MGLKSFCRAQVRTSGVTRRRWVQSNTEIIHNNWPAPRCWITCSILIHQCSICLSLLSVAVRPLILQYLLPMTRQDRSILAVRSRPHLIPVDQLTKIELSKTLRVRLRPCRAGSEIDPRHKVADPRDLCRQHRNEMFALFSGRGHQKSRHLSRTHATEVNELSVHEIRIMDPGLLLVVLPKRCGPKTILLPWTLA